MPVRPRRSSPPPNTALPAKEFFMFRHPQAGGNLKGVLMGGGADVGLTELGERQSAEMAALIEAMPAHSCPRAIVHSSLQRTRIPAQQMNKRIKLPMVADGDLNERNYGSLQGQPHRVLENETTVKAAVGLETEIKYGKRVLTAMASHLNKDEQPVLFVAHRGNFRAFAKNYGRVMDARNAELYRFKPDMSHPDFPWKIWKVTLNQGKITETPVELKRDLPFSGRPDTSNTQQR